MDLPVKYGTQVPLGKDQDCGQAAPLLAQASIFLGALILIVSVSAALAAPFGARWDWWHFTQGFAILRWSAFGGLASAVLCAAGAAVAGRRYVLPVIGAALGLALAFIPWSAQYRLQNLPAIHDVSTDTNDPPQFALLKQLRKRASNSLAYGGQRLAALQARAYPDIKPLVLSAPPAQAFERALAAAHSMGWLVVDASPERGRIEATASTFWFGFKDDIVVRVSTAAGGSRVDARSVSRIGSGDGGTNARRIRSYLKKIAAQ